MFGWKRRLVIIVIVFVTLQNSEKYPPPWLIAMQRYGPPPSYPTLKIPGLTAPIPDVRLPLLSYSIYCAV